MSEEDKKTLEEANEKFLVESIKTFNKRFPESWGLDRNFVLDSFKKNIEDYQRQRWALINIK